MTLSSNNCAHAQTPAPCTVVFFKVRNRWCINQGIIRLHWSSFKEGETLYPLVYFGTRETGTIRWCNS